MTIHVEQGDDLAWGWGSWDGGGVGPLYVEMIQIKKKRPGNMIEIPSGAQQESSTCKNLLTNENLSLTPGTHVTVGGEASLLKAVLGSCVQW